MQTDPGMTIAGCGWNASQTEVIALASAQELEGVQASIARLEAELENEAPEALPAVAVDDRDEPSGYGL